MDATNWTPGVVPAFPDGAEITGGLTADYNNAGPNTFSYLIVGMSNPNVFSLPSPAGTGTLNINGGLLQSQGDLLRVGVGTNAGIDAPAGTINISAGTLSNNTNAWIGYMDGPADPTSSVNVSGTGTYTQSSSIIISGNDNAGAYGIAGIGALNYSGTGSLTAGGDLRVGLSRRGTFSVTGSGGTVSIGSNATFDQIDSVFNVGITSPTAFSTVNVGGGLGTLVATGADLNVTINSVSDPLVNQIWTIINNTGGGSMRTIFNVAISLTDGFNLGNTATLLNEGITFNVINSATLSSINLQISYVGGSGNDMTLKVLQVTPVPEPSTLVMLLCGLAGMFCSRRFKR